MAIYDTTVSSKFIGGLFCLTYLFSQMMTKQTFSYGEVVHHGSKQKCAKNLSNEYNNRSISATIITEIHLQTTDESEIKKLNRLFNLKNTLFFNTSYRDKVSFSFAPPIYSELCEGQILSRPFEGLETAESKQTSKKKFSKERGIILAHYDVWHSFVLHHTSCSDVMIIFEDDAYVGHQDAGEISMRYLSNFTTDVLYLGFCHDRSNKPDKLSMHCTHAYAVTVHGAQRLLHLIDTCESTPLDNQMDLLIKSNDLTHSYIEEKIDPTFIEYLAEELHLHVLHFFSSYQFGGVFPQVKEETLMYKKCMEFGYTRLECETIPPSTDRTLCNKRGSRAIYVLLNQTWHPISSMDRLYQLHLNELPILPLNEWQFKRFPEGEAI